MILVHTPSLSATKYRQCIQRVERGGERDGGEVIVTASADGSLRREGPRKDDIKKTQALSICSLYDLTCSEIVPVSPCFGLSLIWVCLPQTSWW
jgi:hypothetical protein